MLQLIHEPRIVSNIDRPYLGIRFTAPYQNMFAVVAIKFKELKDSLKAGQIPSEGPFFLRYHRIDMAGQMELEVGVLQTATIAHHATIVPGILPGGLYATQVYRGLGLAANKHLLHWISENHHTIQKSSTPTGDAFACRYEAYLTDPRTEPRKKQWEIELSIQVLPEPRDHDLSGIGNAPTPGM